MMIEGKDYLEWLHEVRKRMREEEKKSGLSGAEWIKKISQEAEEIIWENISKIEMEKR